MDIIGIILSVIVAGSGAMCFIVAGIGGCVAVFSSIDWHDGSTYINLAMAPFCLFFAAVGFLIISIGIEWMVTP